MHVTNRGKEKSPQSGGSGGGLIGSRNVAQFKDCESQKNPPVTLYYNPVKEYEVYGLF